MSEDASDRPTDRCMLRWERSPPLKKTPSSIARKWTFPAKYILQSFCIEKRIDSSVTREKTSFAGFILSSAVSPEVHSGAHPHQSRNSGVGSCDRVRGRRRAFHKVF